MNTSQSIFSAMIVLTSLLPVSTDLLAADWPGYPDGWISGPMDSRNDGDDVNDLYNVSYREDSGWWLNYYLAYEKGCDSYDINLHFPYKGKEPTQRDARLVIVVDGVDLPPLDTIRLANYDDSTGGNLGVLDYYELPINGPLWNEAQSGHLLSLKVVTAKGKTISATAFSLEEARSAFRSAVDACQRALER